MGAAHPDTAGRAGRPRAASARPLRGATPPSRQGSPFMPASIAYHGRRRQWPFRVAGGQLSPSAVTTLTTKPAVSTRPTLADPPDRSTCEVPVIVVVMTPTNHPGADWAIGVVGDGDTRGQRHLEWGSTHPTPPHRPARRQAV